MSRPALESLIAEHEHQALDLLDELPRGDEADSDALAAMDVVRGSLPRLVESVAQTLIDAAWQLAQTEDRGSLEAGTLDEIRLTLGEQPRLSLAITPAVETTGLLLGLDRTAMAWAVLSELAEQAEADAGESLHTCSTAIAERLAAAQPTDGAQPVSRALWIFRCAAVVQAGPSIRVRLLAADHPDHVDLARVLVERHRDAAVLVEAFDEAVQARLVAKVEPPGPPVIDGPKRKFTYVHVILAAIVLGLTLWHYVFR